MTLQGHRHHAVGAELRPLPALRGAHVPGQGQGAQEAALAHPGLQPRAGLSLMAMPDTAEPPGGRRPDRAAARRAAAHRRPGAPSTGPRSSSGWSPMLYGAGLGRMVELARPRRPALIDEFVADELVASLLLAAGIHPESLADRVEEALAAGPPAPRRARRRRGAARRRRGGRARSGSASSAAATAARRRRSPCRAPSSGPSSRRPPR